ncbi:extracellular solute-binding protein [Microbacterium bovistercoris]|uniref:Extracellular solute-binding protein n=1 Tax=Microbacterium bovistercoris TaxID=2293570 RepID=A0A371NWX8_9MICO|nr:extracellular solute-binding protein [Microbacterium bovistercoris]REJ06753.1 extracellular solute-binding protein [Microbacterium bovistercoris]
MSLNRIRLASTAGLAVVAIALTACTASAAPDDAGGDKVTIDKEHSVGAMDDFQAGTSFKATEPVTFDLMYRDMTAYPVKDDWSVFTHLDEDRNVTFTRTDIPAADLDQKKSLLIGSGEAGDIISVTYPGAETQFVSGGALLPVSDYFDYLPNFQQKVKDWDLQDEIDARTQEDGKIYLLPGLREKPDVQYSVIVREDLWKKAGITENPETWDDFADQLAQVKAANPELAYPMSDRWTDSDTLGSFLNVMAPNYGTAAGWGYSNTYYDEDAEKYVFTGTTDEYREVVTYAHDLIADGLLDPEVTQSDDQAAEKFTAGKSAAISGNTQSLEEYRKKLADAGMKGELRLIDIPGGPAGSNLPGGRLGPGIMIGADAADKPYFKAMLQFIDWLYYSDEGIEFAQWGIEGETFTRDGDTRVLNDDLGWGPVNPDSEKKLNADYGYSNGVFLMANGSSAELTQSLMTPEIADWTAAQLEAKTVLPIAPPAQLSEMELEQTSLQDTSLKDAVKSATAAFITGQRSLDDWDAYVSEIEALGSDQLIDTINNALAKSK